jgi:putative redox protein
MPAAHVRLTDGYQTTITSRHHTYFADEPLESHGTDTMVTPTEMLMGSLGACMAMTCKMYAQRKGWDLQGIEIWLDFERFNGNDYANYTGDAQFIHEIRERFLFHGNLSEEQHEKLLEIAAKCPVSRLLEYPTFFMRERVK